MALPTLDVERAGDVSRHVAAIRDAIIKGWARPGSEPGDNRAVHALVESFRNALDDGLAASVPVTDAGRQRDLTRIEEVAGSPAPAARMAAKESLTVRDAAIIENNVTPPTPPAPNALRAVFDELIRDLAAVSA